MVNMMKIDRVIVGELLCNCYVVGNDNEVIVIDPGDDYDKIIDCIGDRYISGIIITHGHFDHIGCVDRLVSKYKCSIYDRYNLIEGRNNIGSFSFEVIYNPGHTNDSISIYFVDDKIMFTGDFIFKESVGRTDLGGNMRDMMDSIDKIKRYDDDIILYPGHGDSTILGYEKKNNPFF